MKSQNKWDVRRPTEGKCCICGRTAMLTFEHVPPRKAFNFSAVRIADFEKAIGADPGSVLGGRVSQKGAGAYTLCDQCNNATGSWYADEYIQWAHKGMEIVVQLEGKSSQYYTCELYPLRVLKQIIAMFCSTNGPEFQDAHPGLAEFILGKESQAIPQELRLFAYYNVEGMLRSTGIGAQWNDTHGRFFTSSEISFPPFGYVMTFGEVPFDTRLFDITHFSEFGYGDRALIELRLPVLPTHTMFQGDYRSLDQIDRDKSQNEHDLNE